MIIAFAILQVGEKSPKFLTIPIHVKQGEMGLDIAEQVLLQRQIVELKSQHHAAIENQIQGKSVLGQTDPNVLAALAKIDADYSWKILAIVPDTSGIDDLGHTIDESSHHLSVILETLNRNIGDLISVTARTK